MNFDNLNKNLDNYIQIETKKGDKNNGLKIAIKIISFIAFIFFAINVVLVGFLFNFVKNNSNKRLNINYYNINDSGESISAYAVQNAWQSSVCISAGGNVYDENSFYNETVSRGSGVIFKIDEENIYILTCYHVVCDDLQNIFILFPSILIPKKATLVGYSNDYDIAVLKVENSQNLQNCFEITAKNSQLLSIGENVFAIGNSLSGGLSATSGIISRINKEVLVEGNVFREIQTDASINPGNSGGGLFNSEGKFIGLVNAKLCYTKGSSETSFVEGTAFAIPGTLAISIANSIIQNEGFPRKIELGMSFENLRTNISVLNIDDNLITDYEVRVNSVDKNILGSEIHIEDVVLSFNYYDLNGDLKTVYMSNKYCFDDVSFDIMFNSDIEFNIIRPLTNENLFFTVKARYQTIQK